MSLGSDLWVGISLTEGLCADLTDVTLADEDTKLCKLCKLASYASYASYANYASYASWWLILELM